VAEEGAEMWVLGKNQEVYTKYSIDSGGETVEIH
jgi:hypothetical protein